MGTGLMPLAGLRPYAANAPAGHCGFLKASSHIKCPAAAVVTHRCEQRRCTVLCPRTACGIGWLPWCSWRCHAIYDTYMAPVQLVNDPECPEIPQKQRGQKSL